MSIGSHQNKFLDFFSKGEVSAGHFCDCFLTSKAYFSCFFPPAFFRFMIPKTTNLPLQSQCKKPGMLARDMGNMYRNLTCQTKLLYFFSFWSLSQAKMHLFSYRFLRWRVSGRCLWSVWKVSERYLKGSLYCLESV